MQRHRIIEIDERMMAQPGNDHDAESRARRRLRGFVRHLVGYFAVMVVLVPINFMTTPGNPWFVLPMVGWGSVLALHVAWVMGLFDGFGRS